jgi:hypothetical protein
MTYLFNRVIIEDEDIKKISETIEKYNTLFRNISDSPIGTYSINNILENVEEALNYLEIFKPVLKRWIEEYLEKNRGKLWLYYGISKGDYLADYWKIRETDFSQLISTWPFLYKRNDIVYKNFIVDLMGAQSEILRQRERQSTSNPNYKPFHPDGCCSGCSCWMLDDMEQWYTEEQEEINASKNIFFNGKLQSDFYKTAIEDLEGLKEQWVQWEPQKLNSRQTLNNTLSLIPGQTPIKIVISWIKSDFYYSSAFSMFHWSDIFKNVWENIDSVDEFIKLQRDKLKKIIDLL